MAKNYQKISKIAPVIPVLPRYYPGIFPGILGILGTPVFLNWPLATLSMELVINHRFASIGIAKNLSHMSPRLAQL